jgi:hypothetical protein
MRTNDIAGVRRPIGFATPAPCRKVRRGLRVDEISWGGCFARGIRSLLGRQYNSGLRAGARHREAQDYNGSDRPFRHHAIMTVHRGERFRPETASIYWLDVTQSHRKEKSHLVAE